LGRIVNFIRMKTHSRELYRAKVEVCFSKLKSSARGLSQEEVERRLKIYGPNDIKVKEERAIVKLLKKFVKPIQLMIEFAAVISLLIGKIEDFFIITCLLMINVLVEFAQEYKAENIIKTLKNRLTTSVDVLRDNEWRRVNIRNLVPGDVIRIKQVMSFLLI